MTWGSFKFTLDELVIAMRHRLVVITYFLIWTGLFPFRFRPDVPALDIWREIMVFLLAQAAVILFFPAAVAAMAFVQRGRPNPSVYITPVVFLGTLIGSGLATLAMWCLTGVLAVDLGTILIYAFLQVVLAELVGSIVVTFLLPTIMAEIRARNIKVPVPHADALGERLVLPPDPPVREDTVAPISPDVVFGGRKLPKHQVRFVRAAGNYLDVTASTDKLFVQATMRSFLQQMYASDGLLLHRSLWIAAAEVVSFQRQGLDIFVLTRDGEAVKTARSRQSEVLAWLKNEKIPRRATAYGDPYD